MAVIERETHIEEKKRETLDNKERKKKVGLIVKAKSNNI